MITEIALLNIAEDKLTTDFEKDFNIAKQYISGIKGFIKLELKKCLENPKQYLLVVYWETLENHTIDFRKSKEYLEWKRLLHHYYHPFPVVEHYENII